MRQRDLPHVCLQTYSLVPAFAHFATFLMSIFSEITMKIETSFLAKFTFYLSILPRPGMSGSSMS